MNNLIKILTTKRWVCVLFIILTGMIAYHNCLPNEMFWDDDDFILNNRFIRDFHYWPLWFSQNLVAGSYLVSNYWRPLLLIIFAAEWQWWHTWVYGWHAVAVASHILAAIMLYFLINRLTNPCHSRESGNPDTNNLLALLTALIFVAHPVHNEAVVYVNSMGDSLATFFVLSSLFLFAGFRQSGKPAWGSRSYYLSILAFPLALLSKETGIVLAGILPLMDFLLLSDQRLFWARVRRTLISVWPFILTALIYLRLRATVLNFSNSFNFYNTDNVFTSHLSIRLMTFFKAMTQYTGFLFIPYQLRVERQFDFAQSLWQWDVIAGGLLVGFMLYCAFKYWKTQPLISFGIGWFFIAIAPASNILVIINALLYEHYLYMPMIGIVLIVAYLGLQIAQKRQALPTLLKIFSVIIIIFCAINIHRNLDWRTAIGFYEQLASYRTDDYRVILNLGMEYANKGIHDKAEYWYNKALALDPKNPVAYHDIAGLYRDTGRIQLALDYFHKALALNPNFIWSYQSLADLYWRLGQYEQCKENLLQLLRMDAYNANAQHALQLVEEKLK